MGKGTGYNGTAIIAVMMSACILRAHKYLSAEYYRFQISTPHRFANLL